MHSGGESRVLCSLVRSCKSAQAGVCGAEATATNMTAADRESLLSRALAGVQEKHTLPSRQTCWSSWEVICREWLAQNSSAGTHTALSANTRKGKHQPIGFEWQRRQNLLAWIKAGIKVFSCHRFLSSKHLRDTASVCPHKFFNVEAF